MVSRHPSKKVSLPQDTEEREDNHIPQQNETSIIAQTVYIECSISMPPSQEIPDESNNETLKRAIQVSTLLSQLKEHLTGPDPVPLTFTNQLSVCDSQRRNSCPIDPQFSETTEGIDANKLFERAVDYAKREAFALYSTSVGRTSFEQRFGTTVCVIGRAGIGKTVFSRMMLESLLSTSSMADNTYVFYINCQAIDYTKKCNVLQLLVPSCTHSKESVEILLGELNQSANVTIFIEGLDKASEENFSEFLPPTFLYDLSYPADILRGLLSGHLLMNARKLVTLRTGAFRQLHEAYKPHFVLKVLVLAKDGKDALCRKLCPDSVSYQNVEKYLSEQRKLNDICHVPVYLITVVNHISKCSSQQAISITDILISQLQDFILTNQFPPSLLHLQSIAKLAFNCKRKNTRNFAHIDVAEAVLEVLKPFCSEYEAQETIHLEVKTKKYRFEQIWQDFFVAFHLIRFCSPDELTKHLTQTAKTVDHWETPLKFLFGMCNPVVLRKIYDISIGNCNWNFSERVNCLKSFLKNSPLGKQYQVLRLCRLVQECQYSELQTCLAEIFPEVLTLGDRLMPNEESALVSTLTCMIRSVRIKCNPTHPLSFSSPDGIGSFLGAVNTKHEIETMHVREATIGISEMKLVIPQLSNLTLLELVDCNITDRTTCILAEGLSKRTNPIDILNLSKNPIASLDNLSQCIENVDVWWLTKNKITGNGLKSFCSKIRYTKHPIKQLDLGGNPIKRLGVEHIASCIPELKILGLEDCNLTSDDIKLFTDVISTLKQPMFRLFLDWNLIGDLGAQYLAQCASKIQWLHLGNCGISMDGVQEFRDQSCCRIMGLNGK